MRGESVLARLTTMLRESDNLFGEEHEGTLEVMWRTLFKGYHRMLTGLGDAYSDVEHTGSGGRQRREDVRVPKWIPLDREAFKADGA